MSKYNSQKEAQKDLLVYVTTQNLHFLSACMFFKAIGFESSEHNTAAFLGRIFTANHLQ